MKETTILADRFDELYLSGRWICGTNVWEVIEKTDRVIALKRIDGLNSIAMLTFHLSYYLKGVLNVLNGGKLDIRDKFSFDMPPIACVEDWSNLKNACRTHAMEISSLLRQMSDNDLNSDFSEGKYGTIERNIEGLIEHGYYHLGQMVLIRKLCLNSIS